MDFAARLDPAAIKALESRASFSLGAVGRNGGIAHAAGLRRAKVTLIIAQII
jgi:hypothetical protein